MLSICDFCQICKPPLIFPCCVDISWKAEDTSPNAFLVSLRVSTSKGLVGATDLICPLPPATGTIGAKSLGCANTLDCTVGATCTIGNWGRSGDPEGGIVCCIKSVCTYVPALEAATSTLTLLWELISGDPAPPARQALEFDLPSGTQTWQWEIVYKYGSFHGEFLYNSCINGEFSIATFDYWKVMMFNGSSPKLKCSTLTPRQVLYHLQPPSSQLANWEMFNSIVKLLS